MTSKLGNALKQKSPSRKNRLPVAPEVVDQSTQSSTKQAPSRQGLVSVNFWVEGETRQYLKQVANINNTSVQSLLIEAVNDLFQKYDHPRSGRGKGDES